MKLAAAFLVCVCHLAFAQPADLDAWAGRAMKTFEVPGMAVGIVKDGKLIFAKGYGVRKLGDVARVDDRTLFGIASNTKAFTAAALAILVDEGKLDWDDPVQKHLPSFQLYDPLASRELTVRDLLSHRTGLGLGAGDLLFWPDTNATRADVLAGARHIRPASSFRSRYAYNNLAFVVAGEVVRAASGMEWEQFVRDRIFTRLGMSDSRISGSEGQNVAHPHSRGWRLAGRLTPAPPTRDDVWAAAAGIRSNVQDLSKWMLAQLGAGERPWSEKSASEMWDAQTLIRMTEYPTPLQAMKPNFSAYGLGWSLRDYRGRKIVSHGGGLTGMVTTTYLVPEESLGIVVLTNQEESGALISMVYHVLDYYLKAPATDWIAAKVEARRIRMERARSAEAKLEAERATDTRPSLAAAKYAGEYEDPWYGRVTIGESDGKLNIQFGRTPAISGTLEHWQYDTFRAVFHDKTTPDALVTFVLDYRGRVDEVKLRALSPLADFSFDYQDLLLKPVRR